MFWIILIIIVIVIIYFSKSKGNNSSSNTISNQNTSRTVPTPGSISKTDLYATELIRDIRNLFEDISHVHHDGQIMTSIDTDEDGTKWIRFIVFFVDNVGLFNMAITAAMLGQAENPDRDINQTLHTLSMLLFGGDKYKPLSDTFESPFFQPYEKGAYRPYEQGRGEIGGYYLYNGIIISPVSLVQVDNPLSYDESKHVDDNLLFEAVRQLALSHPNIKEIAPYNGITMFEFNAIDDVE